MANGLQLLVVLGAAKNTAGELLVARRVNKAIPDAYNKWEFPGGKVDYGELPEQALLREMHEETGLQVQVQRLLPVVFTNVWTRVDAFEFQVFILTYECRIISGELTNARVQDEIGELVFKSKDELVRLDLLPNVRDVLQFL